MHTWDIKLVDFDHLCLAKSVRTADRLLLNIWVPIRFHLGRRGQQSQLINLSVFPARHVPTVAMPTWSLSSTANNHQRLYVLELHKTCAIACWYLTRTTLLAAVRLRPVPPASVEMRNTVLPLSSQKLAMLLALTASGILPSNLSVPGMPHVNPSHHRSITG